MTLSADRFAEFFTAVHEAVYDEAGIAPFAWQSRLLATVIEQGRWPEVIDAPTSAGKTHVIDVHVFAVALMAAGAVLVRVPRRLSMVVDRRVLVDDQYEHARRLADALATAKSGILFEVAESLRSLRVGKNATEPLMVTRLRGGLPAPRAWRDDAIACQIICATPDMWGSRLLMAGYGSSELSRPREAGLLAFDSVLVVDEAHLSRQLIYTARRVAELAVVADRRLPVPVLQVVEASATPDRSETALCVGVQDADLAEDAALRERLCRAKPIELLELPVWPIPGTGPSRAKALAAMADRAIELRSEYGPTVGCFVNNVATATQLAELLGRTHQVRMICGRLRPYDVERLVNEQPASTLSLSGNPEVDFLISTQSLEVGVNVDWTAALVEIAPGTAIAQRAGRVNRRGRRGRTRVVVAVPDKELKDKTDTAPYEPGDLNDCLAWLRERAADPAGLAPWALREHPPPPQRQRRTLLQRPELGDAWMWSRTNDELFATPDLDLWLSDDLSADHDIGIVIRRNLPVDPATAVALLRELPPMDHETIPAQIRLAGRRLADLTSPVYRVRGDEVLPYNHDTPDDEQASAFARDLRPGDIVVVDTTAAIFTVIDGMPVLTPTGTDCGDDVLEAGDGTDPGRFVFLLGRGSTLDPDRGDDEDIKSAIAHVLSTAADLTPKELAGKQGRQALAEALEKLAPLLEDSTRVLHAIGFLEGRLKDFDVTLFADDPDGPPSRLLMTDNRRMIHDESARQRWTRAEQRVTLRAHASGVAERALLIGERLGLGPYAELLARAGLHHDDGKAHPRFQRSLDPELTSPEPLAKSGMTTQREIRKARAQSGLPGAWRHEQLSVLIAWNALHDLPPADRDLAARLIGTSHGHGRPGFPHTSAQLGADPHLVDLARRLFDEGAWDHLIERTHTDLGVWGCAYLEALLRCADGQISGEGS
ncbi:type I-U CRISPR-associated helicase/endonuclease Cas3 [Thermopolyspora sp. NPDC052614]|uniref:type I-G CRISPR-associated helicase/endonuclease Cas3g n=1 Tax=Thermopolyspora sp. NPDC052614 TaxID=3155682 RepID=UPI0034458146